MAKFWEKVWVSMIPQYNCGWPYDNCALGDWLKSDWWMLLREWIIYLSIVIIISLLITLWFYLVYRHRKDEHPWKCAIKKSWAWRIIVLFIPIIVFAFFLLYDYVLIH